ncbi:tyrosine-type recombinase/integrase [Streptomyces sp. CB02130]|uniref:tyrosine-type recombinase/integrase n=1 Tax=Streptomyces sp. CB02130 TaxID=1703934 RepID=UPI001301879F|nr:tyrosine-type recombinase/integrase [Streptomyces sp. CB02130]
MDLITNQGVEDSSATAAQRAHSVLTWGRDALGTVAPRNPATGKLGQRRHRVDLLAEAVEPKSLLVVLGWLMSTTIPSERSKISYADDIRFWAAYATEIGYPEFSIGCLSADDVRFWRLTQEQRGAKPRTINRRLSALSSLTRYAEDEIGHRLPVCVRRSDRLRIDRLDTSTATPVIEVQELQRVMACCRDNRELLIVALIYTLAGRVSETCTADVDQLVDRGPYCELHLRRKGGKTRSWPVPATLRQLFDRVLNGRSDGPLLLDAAGRRLDRHDVDRLLTRLGREAKVLTCPSAQEVSHRYAACRRCRDLTPHVLRASRLTHMHDEGVKLEDIQEYADHADPSTTLAYIRRRNASLRRGALAAASTRVFAPLLDERSAQGGP